ncbi:MAG: D-Ala-D-Ala carboxypeptidase family metallohydrolase [Pirellulales bacterium]|nr:D-Ala-D-Ala carboxypeptidase family metallohydrolase [Pirellulales bacterium]
MKPANDNVNLIELKEETKQFMAVLENELGRQLVVTSGYRSPDHPIEAKKSKPGEHSTGLAVDVAAIGGYEVFTLVKKAMELGCKRIGISRKSNFVHLGLDKSRVTSIWTY